MGGIYKSEEGARAVRERYLQFLERWPSPSQHLRIPTCQGETFVVACGPPEAPPLVLLHGGAGNSAMWLGDIAVWAADFRIYAVDVIGEPGFSAPSRPPLKSDAYVLWLRDVMQGLSLARASMIGVSLGGWLALRYATRRPGDVDRLAVICPGGIGRQRIGIALQAIPLRLFGRWGAAKARELVLGRLPFTLSPAARAFMQFVSLIHENFRPRLVKMPVFSDHELRRLNMPVMVIVGGKDVLLDSAETQRRVQAYVAGAEVRLYPELGHLIPGQAAVILDFLRRSAKVHA